jgi:hypothetical protein
MLFKEEDGWCSFCKVGDAFFRKEEDRLDQDKRTAYYPPGQRNALEHVETVRMDCLP